MNDELGNKPPQVRGAAEFKVIVGAGLAVSVACLTGMLTLNELGVAQLRAVCCFAVAVPTLAGALLMRLYGERWDVHTTPWHGVFLWVVGAFAVIGGLQCVFWHFGSGPGIVGSATSLVVMSCLLADQRKVDRVVRDRKDAGSP